MKKNIETKQPELPRSEHEAAKCILRKKTKTR